MASLVEMLRGTVTQAANKTWRTKEILTRRRLRIFTMQYLLLSCVTSTNLCYGYA